LNLLSLSERDRAGALLRQAKYKNSFIFKYSPRPGTIAIDRFEDDVPDAVKKIRNNRLLAVQAEVSAEVHAEYVGRVVEVFVNQANPVKRSTEANPLGNSNGNVELTWERQQRSSALATSPKSQASSPMLSLSGRTVSAAAKAGEPAANTHCVMP
jgi:tRNA-2-methylthio-N6-dimethylallyladenosine synthase